MTVVGTIEDAEDTLWIALDRVNDKVPNDRPWNADLNDMMDKSGDPGA